MKEDEDACEEEIWEPDEVRRDKWKTPIRHLSPYKISFNEDIVVCKFKSDKPPIQIQQKIKSFQNKQDASWVHPSLQPPKKLAPILKAVDHK